MTNLNIFLFTFLLCLHDALMLRQTAGTPEAYLWAVLALVSAVMLHVAARSFMPRD
jgi:hypothetical protein